MAPKLPPAAIIHPLASVCGCRATNGWPKVPSCTRSTGASSSLPSCLFLCRCAGAPDDLVNYFHFVAEEVRAGLAALGLRSMDELIGRADLLRQVSAAG